MVKGRREREKRIKSQSIDPERKEKKSEEGRTPLFCVLSAVCFAVNTINNDVRMTNCHATAYSLFGDCLDVSEQCSSSSSIATLN